MPSDYSRISEEHRVDYGRNIERLGRYYTQHYTTRTHFILELLQNAEDALLRRERIEPICRSERSVSFRLFKEHLEVTHYGIPFDENDVKSICAIDESTKENELNAIVKFGVGFKSVFTYTCHPEIHSADEHFFIESYVFPRAVARRDTLPNQTLFHIPFDHEEIPPEQAHAEISKRLAKLGFGTLLFLNQIESVDWEIVGKTSGSYIRETKVCSDYKEVTLVGQLNPGDTAEPLDEQHWIVFSRPVSTPTGETAGKVEIAFRLARDRKSSKRSIVKAEDSNLVVFFPTEKETRCGFLMQGPYMTTPSRDNIPRDNKWNVYLVEETAKLVAETLLKLADLKMVSVGLLQAMPLLLTDAIPEDWMFRPVYDAVVETLSDHALIPSAGGRLISGRCARIARGKGLVDLFAPKQLSLLLGTDEAEKLDWVTPEISERDETRDLFAFLREVLDVPQIEPEHLPPRLTEEFFQAQSISWMIRFYTFLLDHEGLWRKENPRGPLLNQPFIRLQDKRHVTPFRADHTPNVFMPGDSDSDFDTVHHRLANHKKCAELLRKLEITVPDITDEVLPKVIPQYDQEEVKISENKHQANLRKIFRALDGESSSRSRLVECLADLTFLTAVTPGSSKEFYCKPGMIYFHSKSLETFFENHKDVWFLAEPEKLVGQDKIKAVLKELGVEDKPRRILVTTDEDAKKKISLRGGQRCTRDICFIEYDIHGLSDFLKRLKELESSKAARRARLLWDFLICHLDSHSPGTEWSFFRGEYRWYYSVPRGPVRFDAHFLEVLRSKAWLPGKDGKLHKPSELLPQEMPSGFVRHPILCAELQMKAEQHANLVKEFGAKAVEDLKFIRQHREEFEKLKRSMKAIPPATANPVALRTLAATVPASATLSADHSRPEPSGGRPVEIAPAEGTLAGQPPSKDEVAEATKTILGSDSTAPTPMPTELDRHEAGSAVKPTGTGSDGTKHSDGDASSMPPTGQSKTSTTRHQDGKYFTYVYVSPNGSAETAVGNGGEPAEEIYRREKVGREGVDCVLEWERKAGRDPTEMPQTNEGYDVESRTGIGEVERYIEVKSVGASWGERGVTLSKPQFEAAQRLQEKCWLYVVENADSAERRLFCIQNPALRVKYFAYDQGWRHLDESSP